MPVTSLEADQDDHPIIQRLIFESEIGAERLIAWVRITIALGLGAIMVVATEVADHFDLLEPTGLMGAGRGVMVTGSVFLLLGLLALYLTGASRWRPWMAYLFAALDSLMITAAIFSALSRQTIDGTYAAAVPAAFAIPVVFAINGLRPRPRVQLFATVMTVAGILAVVIARSQGFDPPEGSPGNLPRFFAFPANVLRLTLLVGMGVVIAIGMQRARLLLTRSVRETRRRKALTRFLPSEIAPMISEGRFDALRRGQRRIATVLFADIRDSTARAEGLDPQRLSVFISSFRRRVMRAAIANGGIVDKFVGDGALILFGVLGEGNDGARQALACARDLHVLIDRWNEKRRFSPPVRVGIGIHTGEVYVGVVGDEHRLEFTVLGDTVNIAARLEQLTKVIGTPLLVSGDSLQAAGGMEGWRLAGCEPLRGRVGQLPFYTTQDGPDWNLAPPAAAEA